MLPPAEGFILGVGTKIFTITEPDQEENFSISMVKNS